MNNYAQLLTQTLPGIVETEAENERILGVIENLIDKSELSPDERKLLKLLTRLVEDFEEKAYPMGNSSPANVLRLILEERGMKQKDLLPIFGSEGAVSDILNEKRPITIKTAKKLAEFLGLSSYKILI